MLDHKKEKKNVQASLTKLDVYAILTMRNTKLASKSHTHFYEYPSSKLSDQLLL